MLDINKKTVCEYHNQPDGKFTPLIYIQIRGNIKLQVPNYNWIIPVVEAEFVILQKLWLQQNWANRLKERGKSSSPLDPVCTFQFSQDVFKQKSTLCNTTTNMIFIYG